MQTKNEQIKNPIEDKHSNKRREKYWDGKKHMFVCNNTEKLKNKNEHITKVIDIIYIYIGISKIEGDL